MTLLAFDKQSRWKIGVLKFPFLWPDSLYAAALGFLHKRL